MTRLPHPHSLCRFRHTTIRTALAYIAAQADGDEEKVRVGEYRLALCVNRYDRLNGLPFLRYAIPLVDVAMREVDEQRARAAH